MNAKDYRQIAWRNVKANLGIAMLAGLIALYLGGLLINSNVSVTLPKGDGTSFTIQSLLLYPVRLLRLGTILSMAQFVLGGVIRQGYCVFLLKQHDGKNPEIQDLFSWFDKFSKGFILFLLEGLYIFLWTLLLIVPGIIASYRYAMAPFILAENPDMTPSEAIDASKELMDGHKGELFTLNLTFIGWDILAMLTLGIGYLWLNPYKNAAHTAFYRDLITHRNSTVVE